ncbi:MAG: phosphotyrosine protein phosphatase [Psychroserpens sp.]|nr:phosphotyrosine protein phosphatase [Psychroserpens sp.]
MNVLFVCTINRMRSLSANEIFKDDPRFEVRSAGTAKDAKTRISNENLNWADYILVMERPHRNKIREEFPDIYNNKRILCMYIEDNYDYMDSFLIELLKGKFDFLWRTEIEPDTKKLNIN